MLTNKTLYSLVEIEKLLKKTGKEGKILEELMKLNALDDKIEVNKVTSEKFKLLLPDIVDKMRGNLEVELIISDLNNKFNT